MHRRKKPIYDPRLADFFLAGRVREAVFLQARKCKGRLGDSVALYDVPVFLEFRRIEIGRGRAPDATLIAAPPIVLP